MEPADQAQLHSKLGRQDALLESQQQQLESHQMAILSTTVQAVQSTSASWTPPPSTSESGGA